MTRTLSFYIAGRFFRSLMFTFLLFIGLIVTVDLIELSRELARVESVSFFNILTIAVLRAPSFAENILPFAMLFGAAGSLLLLNRRLELVVARASGVSVWQFLAPMILTALAVGLAAALLYNPLSLLGQNHSRAAESAAFGKVKGAFANNSSNFWVRLGQPEGDVVIRARVSEFGGAKLTGVSAYRFDADGRSVERLDAAGASFVTVDGGQNHYLLTDVTVTVPGERSAPVEQLELPVNISRSQLQANAAKPEEVGFWSLNDQADRAEQAGRNPLPFITQFYALVAQPLLFAAMVLVAATFSLRFARFGQNGKLILAGIAAGFLVYVASRLVLTFGSNGLAPPPLAAWSPALIAVLIASTVLLHQEDG